MSDSNRCKRKKPTPAVPVKQSIRQDRIICLEDGNKVSTLIQQLDGGCIKLNAAAVSREVGTAARLPDGGAELCRDEVRAGQEDRARAEGRKAGGKARCRSPQARLTPAPVCPRWDDPDHAWHCDRREGDRRDFRASSGPGGQNVNKVATAVQLRFDPAISGLPEDTQARLRALAGRRPPSRARC